MDELAILELKKSGYLNNENVKGFASSSIWMIWLNLLLIHFLKEGLPLNYAQY
jgi:hypothetical protein